MLYILIVMYFYYYVMCYFVSLNVLNVMYVLILIVIYVPFFVFCLTMFCVLFVCKCVLYTYAATGCQPSCS
jgi:hypothetical protein